MERAPRRFPHAGMAVQALVGTDLITMWRWLRTEQVDVDPLETHGILSATLTVRKWMVRRSDRRVDQWFAVHRTLLSTWYSRRNLYPKLFA
jgi:hypothetical protein